RARRGRRLSFIRAGVPHGHPPLPRTRAARAGVRDRGGGARPAGDRDRRRDARAGPRAARRRRVWCGGDPSAVGRRRSSGDRPEYGAGADAMNETIDITVNGQLRTVSRGVTLLGLLASFWLVTCHVSVDRNRHICRPHALYTL